MKNFFQINQNFTPTTNTDESFYHFLVPEGAFIILGEQFSNTLVMPLEPNATTMFGPRGVCLVSETGPLWVADTGHHRLLGWKNLPETDGKPADLIIGQPDFHQEGQNANGTPQSNTLSVPTGICTCGEGLAVADAWNHRVLIWKELPQDHNVPADIVLGQTDFHQNQVNRGEINTAADRMHWPYGVFYHQGYFFVADTGNRRVLVWNRLPEVNGQPADFVLGQSQMNLRDENGGGIPTASSMRWPHALAIWQDNLVVTDAGNNRVMIWDGIPTENNVPCKLVLGQSNFEDVELNQGVYWPSSRSLSMPYGVAVCKQWLMVADTSNSRLLGWKNFLEMGISSQGLIGQLNFRSKGENRAYGRTYRNSLSWPYGISICGDTAIIADSGNNRVLLWSVQSSNK
ncbi:MAG: NHL repeat-containing protein [cyanobacterium endosymbiont of Rhopalodia musculus]|uniref:NHL repeat-containing protein n=1 Tax=cyanobacterium endosymbiont of Epithemia clementina EcSB TaxID=3034674 RepID=UPI0024815959|nr:NHL repeat-containing protein [cyanobacterium endosymbiont of Epithemia clementina EcSB]WGT67931.1 NHL repeat-containing protein [cyanobacterium endosymbiont of Epithemia clementina EcSB]